MQVTASRLTCRVAQRIGAVRAEWWNLPVNTYSMPDITHFATPDALQYVRSLHAYDLSWVSPVPGVINRDFFAGRFTWQLGPIKAGTYTFKYWADDGIRLYTVGAALVK